MIKYSDVSVLQTTPLRCTLEDHILFRAVAEQFRAATFAAVNVLPENDSPSPIISTLQLVDTR